MPASPPSSSSPLPTVSVVVPTYRRRDGLAVVLQPLLDDPATTEVVVVVDGSHDGSIELLRDLARTRPALVPVLTENQGPAAARQHGIDLSRGEVVLLVDDDVVAAPGLVTGHARHHAGAAGLVVLGYMPTRVPSPPGRDGWSTELYAREYEAACRAYERDPADVLLRLWGGNLSVRRSDLARVPFLSPDFRGTYHEDSDFGVRCHRAGLRGVFDRSLASTHEHRRDMAQFRRDARRQGAGHHELLGLHGDLLGAGAAGPVASSRASRVAAAVQHPTVLPVAAALASGATTALSRLGLHRPAVTTARVVRRLELARGAAGG